MPQDRLFWVALSRMWSNWRDALIIVKPETVVRWHLRGFRAYWCRKCRGGLGGQSILGLDVLHLFGR
jgi:hypothetical protein